MAVGKGSMDRASKAAKNQKTKNIKTDIVDKIGQEETFIAKIEQEKEINTKKKEITKQKVPVKKTRTKAVNKLSDGDEKDRKKVENKENSGQNINCGIGDEMPVYFL